MYTEKSLKRVSDSLQVKSEVLAKLYPTYLDRWLIL